MNYYQFTVEDFAADDTFKAWVCSPTPEADAFWQAFLKDYPERYYQVQEARELVVGLLPHKKGYFVHSKFGKLRPLWPCW
jgi:transmembrane sensor